MPNAFVNVVNSSTASFNAPGGPHRSSFEQKSNYQTPASALYGAYEDSSSQGSSSSYGNLYMHGFLIQLLSLCSWIVFSWLLFPPITIISPTRFLWSQRFLKLWPAKRVAYYKISFHINLVVWPEEVSVWVCKSFKSSTSIALVSSCLWCFECSVSFLWLNA